MSRITENMVATAIQEIILGLGLTPQTTVVAAHAGNNYADVADASQFLMLTTATWWDQSGEPEMAITTVDTTVTPHRITFESPLQFTHAAGAVIATNLLDYAPDQVGMALAKNNPLIFICPVRSALGWTGSKLASGPVHVHVQVNLLDEQRGVTLHPNLWTKQQQKRAKDLLSQIVEAVANNHRLTTTTYGGPIAIGIGDEQGKNLAEMAFDRFTSSDEVPVYAAATVIIVRPRPMSIR